MLPPRAYVFIFLNITRILSIIALLLVFSSNIVILVTDIEAVNHFVAVQHSGNTTLIDKLLDCEYIQGSTVPNQPAGVFWSVLNRLLILAQVVGLVFSEFGWPMSFFDKYFPVLGSEFGMGALGVIECLLGAAVLSHYVDDFALVSAFFLFALGCLNILIGLIWRDRARSKRSLTSWKDHAKSALPLPVSATTVATAKDAFEFAGKGVQMSMSGLGVSLARNGDAGRGMGFGSQAEKAAGLRGFLITKPVESLPRYYPTRTHAAAKASVHSVESNESDTTM